MKKRIGINGTIIFLSVICAAVFWKQVVRPAGMPLDRVLEPVGLVLLLTGVLLRVSSRGFKSEHSAGGHALVQGGPYDLVRNPMYLGIFCCGMGAVMLFLQWWVILVFFSFMCLRYLTLIRKEEKILKERFGEEYLRYLARVPRLVPSPKVLFSGRAAALLPLRLRWIKKESSSLVFLLPGVAALVYWRANYLCPQGGCGSGAAVLAMIAAAFLLFTLLLARGYEKISA